MSMCEGCPGKSEPEQVFNSCGAVGTSSGNRCFELVLPTAHLLGCGLLIRPCSSLQSWICFHWKYIISFRVWHVLLLQVVSLIGYNTCALVSRKNTLDTYFCVCFSLVLADGIEGFRIDLSEQGCEQSTGTDQDLRPDHKARPVRDKSGCSLAALGLLSLSINLIVAPSDYTSFK